MYTIYATKKCPYCTQAKDLLTKVEQDVTVHYIDEDQNRLAEFRAKFPNATTVPQITISDGKKEQYIGGYSELVEHVRLFW